MSDERAKLPAIRHQDPRDLVREQAPAASRGIAETAGPTFSEEQVAEILQRTAHLERVRSLRKTELTLAEVEQIARESGLDASLVAIAAESLEEDEADAGMGARLLGAVTQRTFERVLDGEITAGDHESISAEIRSAVRAEGPLQPPQLSAVGRTLSLAARTMTGRIELELGPRAGKTILRVAVDTEQLAGGLFGGIIGGFGGASVPLVVFLSVNSQLGAPGIVFGTAIWLTAVYAAARSLFSWRANKQYERMENLADRLAESLRKQLASRNP